MNALTAIPGSKQIVKEEKKSKPIPELKFDSKGQMPEDATNETLTSQDDPTNQYGTSLHNTQGEGKSNMIYKWGSLHPYEPYTPGPYYQPSLYYKFGKGLTELLGTRTGKQVSDFVSSVVDKDPYTPAGVGAGMGAGAGYLLSKLLGDYNPLLQQFGTIGGGVAGALAGYLANTLRSPQGKQASIKSAGALEDLVSLVMGDSSIGQSMKQEIIRKLQALSYSDNSLLTRILQLVLAAGGYKAGSVIAKALGLSSTAGGLTGMVAGGFLGSTLNRSGNVDFYGNPYNSFI